MKMMGKLFSLKSLSHLSKLVLRKRPGNESASLQSNPSKLGNGNQKHKFLHDHHHHHHQLSNNYTQVLVFNLEAALLKSSSKFAYFMLVAFEAGGLLRALILFLCYPLLWLAGDEELKLKVMVFLCFFGIKKKSFRIGITVLPKFLLEDVGFEGFDVVMRFGKKVGVSDMPTVMVEAFLKNYIGVEAVFGRELKEVCGYFVGLMEDKNTDIGRKINVNETNKENSSSPSCQTTAMSYYNKFDHPLFSLCEEVYLVNEAEKKNWQVLPREKYPKPLIFHDGRLAFRPTPFPTLAMFMWIPFGFFILVIRFIAGLFLPNCIYPIIISLTGIKITVSSSSSSKPEQNSSIITTNIINQGQKPKGILYVCNHRTLLDPLYLQFALMNPLTAVTYSISKINEIIAPIKTIRLIRDRERDREAMKEMLSKGDMVVCPEGTTCREPYLLRFSPLFAELTDDIVPVAINMQVSMFHGTTASGNKLFDPVFHFLNPYPICSVKILEKIPEENTCECGGKSRIEVANYVQKEIGKALGFVCTSITRKDKYMILAGNDGTKRDYSM